MIINLTQHAATAEQIDAGVVEPSATAKALIAEALTFDTVPSATEIEARARLLAELADESGEGVAMIGGAPFFMAPLEQALTERGIRPLYAFTRRESVEQTQQDGGVRKVAVFRHLGFVSAMAWQHRDGVSTRYCESITGLASDCDPELYRNA